MYLFYEICDFLKIDLKIGDFCHAFLQRNSRFPTTFWRNSRLISVYVSRNRRFYHTRVFQNSRLWFCHFSTKFGILLRNRLPKFGNISLLVSRNLLLHCMIICVNSRFFLRSFHETHDNICTCLMKYTVLLLFHWMKFVIFFTIVKQISLLISVLFDEICNFLKSFLDELDDFFMPLLNGIHIFFSRSFDEVRDFILRMLDEIRDFILRTFDEICYYFLYLFDKICNFATQNIYDFRDFLSGHLKKFVTLFLWFLTNFAINFCTLSM